MADERVSEPEGRRAGGPRVRSPRTRAEPEPSSGMPHLNCSGAPILLNAGHDELQREQNAAKFGTAGTWLKGPSSLSLSHSAPLITCAHMLVPVVEGR
jgi:hypothetical protein